MSNQDIFEGQANKWTWAAIDSGGLAWLSEGEPTFTADGKMVAGALFGLKRSFWFDVKEMPQEGLPVVMWEREAFLVEGTSCVEPMCGNLAIDGDKRCTAHALPPKPPEPPTCPIHAEEEPNVAEDDCWQVAALQKAQANAKHLYNCEELTMVQYMAIFGEAPQ